MTLTDLAQASGVSVGMLSSVERGTRNPTIRVIGQIASALGCTMSDLLDEPAGNSMTVVRRGECPSLVDPETGLVRRSIAPPLLERGLQVLHYQLPGNAALGPLPKEAPGVMKHGTLIRGAVRLEAGGHGVDLDEGDSVTFIPDSTHQVINRRNDDAEFIVIIHVPTRP